MDRLATLKSDLRARLEPVRQRATQAWAWTKPRAARAWRQTRAFSKRALIATLMGMEKSLLTHQGRERTQAITVFTLIFAFAVTSVDFLITGGPEFSPGARAATYTSHVDLISPRSARAAPTAQAMDVALNQPATEEVAPETVAPAPRPAARREAVAEPVQKADPEPSGEPARAPKDKA